MDLGSCSRTDLYAAGLTQLGHGLHPGDAHLMLKAQFLDGSGNLGIGILGQIHLLRPSVTQGLFELFGAHNDLGIADIRQFPALGDSTVFFSIHTKTYYTQIFEKVNINMKNNSIMQEILSGLFPNHGFLSVCGACCTNHKNLLPFPWQFCQNKGCSHLLRTSSGAPIAVENSPSGVLCGVKSE